MAFLIEEIPDPGRSMLRRKAARMRHAAHAFNHYLRSAVRIIST